MMATTIPTVNKLPGTIIPFKLGNILKPSIADETDMGGVIIPSASSVVAPNIVGITSFFP